MWAALYLVLALAAASAFYLGSRHQQICVVSQSPRLRRAGWLLLALAWAAAWRALGVWGGGFAMLTAFMLAVVVWPYVDAWRSIRKRRQGPRENARHVG